MSLVVLFGMISTMTGAQQAVAQDNSLYDASQEIVVLPSWLQHYGENSYDYNHNYAENGYIYIIDLFTSIGVRPANIPMLRDVERNEPIHPTVIEEVNFLRLVLRSPHDRITVELYGEGFGGADSWGAFDFGESAFVALTPDFKHVYLQHNIRATHYMTVTATGNLMMTVIKDEAATEESLRFWYNLNSGEAGTPGSRSVEATNIGGSLFMGQADLPELIPYGAARGARRVDYIVSPYTVSRGDTVWFNARFDTALATGAGIETLFSHTTYNIVDHNTAKFAQFTVPDVFMVYSPYIPQNAVVIPEAAISAATSSASYFIYTIDLFTPNGNLPTHNPVLTDVERSYTIDHTVTDMGGFRRLRFTSPYDRITVHMSEMADVWGAFDAGGENRLVALTAEFNHVYLQQNIRATHYMTVTGEGNIMLTVIKDVAATAESLRFWYNLTSGAAGADGSRSVVDTNNGGTLPVHQADFPELIPYGASRGTRRIDYIISPYTVSPGDTVWFSARFNTARVAGAGTETVFSNTTASINQGSVKLAEFIVPDNVSDSAPSTFTYTIDLFTASGTPPTNTPVLRDMERDAVITPTVITDANFMRLTFTSPYDRVTVQLSGAGFGATMWGAFNGQNDKRVVLSPVYNHVFLQQNIRATYYVSATPEGRIRVTIIRNGFGGSEHTTFFYNAVSGAPNAAGSVELIGFNPYRDAEGNFIVPPVFLPYNAYQIPPAGGGNFHQGIRVVSWLESTETFAPGTTIFFNARASVVHSGGQGSTAAFTAGNPGNPLNEAKFGQFTMPFDGDAQYELTFEVEVDGSIVESESMGFFTGNTIVPLSANRPGYHFAGWRVAGGGSFAESTSLNTDFTMPFSDATVTAMFNSTHGLTVFYGTSSIANPIQGDRPVITAHDRRVEGYRFLAWEATGIALNEYHRVANPLSFTMPATDVTLTATFEPIDGNIFNLTVENGTALVGGHSVELAEAGEMVMVTADTPPEGYLFSAWDIEGVHLTPAQRVAEAIWFVMPAQNVSLAAMFEPIPVYFTYTIFVFNYDIDYPPEFYDMTNGEVRIIPETTRLQDGNFGMTFTSTSDHLEIRAILATEYAGVFGNGHFTLTPEYATVYLIGGSTNSQLANSRNPINPPITVYMAHMDDGTNTGRYVVRLSAIKEGGSGLRWFFWSPAVGAGAAGDVEIGLDHPTQTSVPLAGRPELIPSNTGNANVNNLSVFSVTADQGTPRGFLPGDTFWSRILTTFGDDPTVVTLFGNGITTDNPAHPKQMFYIVPPEPFPGEETAGHPGSGRYAYSIELHGANVQIPNLWDAERDIPISARAVTSWPNGMRRVVMEFYSNHYNLTVELYGNGFDGASWGAYNNLVVLTPENNRVHLEQGVRATFYMSASDNGNIRLTAIRETEGNIQFFYTIGRGNITVPMGGVPASAPQLTPFGWHGSQRYVTTVDSVEIIPAGTEVWFKARGIFTPSSGAVRTVFGESAAQTNPAAPKNASFIMPEFGLVIADVTTAARFLDNGTDPSPGSNPHVWAEHNFNDSGWSMGTGPFSHQIPINPISAQRRTAVFGVDSFNTQPGTRLNEFANGQRIATYFFRYNFDLTAQDVVSINSAFYRIRYQDAVVIYINGIRVARHNYPTGGFESNLSFGAARPLATFEERVNHVSVEGLLREGQNTLAIELRRALPDSTNIYLELLDFVLLESVFVPPPLNITALNMQPGAIESQRNFAWQSNADEPGFISIWEDGQTVADARVFHASGYEGLSLRLGYMANRVTVTGLLPGVTYHYRVTNSTIHSQTYTFTTTADPSEFTFFVTADPQIREGARREEAGNAWVRTMNYAMYAFPHASMNVSVGDLVSDADVIAQWDQLFRPESMRTMPFAPTVGNHDFENYGGDGTVSGLNLFPTYYAHFNPPNLYEIPEPIYGGGHYWFPYGDVIFIHINSGPVQQHQGDYPRDWPRAIRFAETAIAEFTEQRGREPEWKIAVFHHPPYAIFRAGSAESNEIRNNLTNEFSRLGIDLVLNGHEHLFLRTHMMTAGTHYAVPVSAQHPNYVGDPLQSGSGFELERGSGYTLYTIVSSGATHFRNPANINVNQNFVARGYALQHASFATVDVTPRSLTVTHFRSDRAIGENSVIDTFTLYRPYEPTVTIYPSVIEITDNNLEQLLTVGGSATGTISVGTLNPASDKISVSPTESGVRVQFTGTMPHAGAPEAIVSGPHTVTVTRQGVEETLTINVNIQEYQLQAIFGLSSTTVTLTNAEAQEITGTGNATGAISAGTLNPANDVISVSPTESGVTVQFTGTMPHASAPEAIISGPHTITVTRQGIDVTLTININIPAYTPTATAGLTNITVSQGTLSPVFDTNVFNYAVSVGNSVTSITVNAIAADGVTVNGTGTHSLSVGQNTIILTASAPGLITQTYTIIVTRASAPGGGGAGVPATPTLLSPSNISLNGTILNWSAVSNATGYQIYVGGIARGNVITTTNFDLATLELSVGTHAIRVRAIHDGTGFNNSPLSIAVNLVVEDITAPTIEIPPDTTPLGDLPPTPWTNPFTDVNDEDWFFQSVRFAHQNNLFAGTSSTTFSPNATMTRGMMVTVLHRMVGTPLAENSAFSDVADGQWYANAVNWAAENGIVAGMGDGRFAPNASITREQMAQILNNYARFMGLELPSIRTGVFNDEEQISGWASQAVSTMFEAGIISGRGNGNFDPQGNATRAEVATLLRNFLEATER